MNIREAYQVLQAEWVKLYNVEVGDTVKVLRKAKKNELGWSNSWESCMFVKQKKRVEGIGHNIVLDDGYGYPFFVLEFVEKGEPKIEIDVRINGRTVKLSEISEETLLNIRKGVK